MLQVQATRFEFRAHDVWLVHSQPDESALVYAPTLRTLLSVTQAASTRIQREGLPESILQRLQSRLPDSTTPVRAPANAFHLGLGLTRNCTLSCAYCHADANKSVYARKSTVLAAIDHAFRAAALTPRKTLSVSFAVGGEPTMHWRLFTEAVDYIRDPERAKAHEVQSVFLSMTTNGFYGPAKREFIGRNFSHLTISCDGPPDIHNRQRPGRHGEDTYDVVAESVRYFLGKRPELRVGIRSTVSDRSVGELPRIVRHFGREFGPGIAVSFEPLIPIGRAESAQDVSSPDINEFAESFLEARRVGRKLGVRVVTSGPAATRLVSQYCGAIGIPSFAVCVDGKVTACHRDQEAADYGYGQIDAISSAIEISEDRLREIGAFARVPSECDECFAKWNCAGDCPDIRRIGWRRCDFNRRLLYEDLRSKLS